MVRFRPRNSAHRRDGVAYTPPGALAPRKNCLPSGAAGRGVDRFELATMCARTSVQEGDPA